ncbi:hypothetical protein [Tropicibacter alexandrii]|uniref:hypothetical protein n=1 Tax=Tropicibacter alexandrii TaxID=2267683 RepID=UPI001008B8C0|nr:hypothetical protein [Tropicibacter alexandrii]
MRQTHIKGRRHDHPRRAFDQDAISRKPDPLPAISGGSDPKRSPDDRDALRAFFALAIMYVAEAHGTGT